MISALKQTLHKFRHPTTVFEFLNSIPFYLFIAPKNNLGRLIIPNPLFLTRYLRAPKFVSTVSKFLVDRAQTDAEKRNAQFFVYAFGGMIRFQTIFIHESVHQSMCSLSVFQQGLGSLQSIFNKNQVSRWSIC